jgi:antitoxin FitA-like protein
MRRRAVGTGQTSSTQYTIRNIPPELDKAIKARAKRLGKSINQVALEALASVVDRSFPRRSLRNMPGAWSKSEAERFDRFLEQHRAIDEELWK